MKGRRFNSYPVEVREVAVEAYERGEGSFEAVARRFSIHPGTLKQWRALKNQTGSLDPKEPARLGRKPELDHQDREFLRQLVEQKPSSVLRELKEELAQVRDKHVSGETVRRTLNQMGIAHKRFGDAKQAQTRRRLSSEAKTPQKEAPAAPEPAASAQEVTAPRYQDKDRPTTEPVFFERTPYPSDLTDEEWAILEPLLRPRTRRGRPRKTPLREIVDAIRYIARTGCQWRYLPHDFPDWQLVARTYYRWLEAGTWEKVNDALREKVRVAEGREPRPTAAIIDSQSVKTTEKGGLEDSMAARRSRVENAIFSSMSLE